MEKNDKPLKINFFTDANGYISVSDNLENSGDDPTIMFCGGSTTECTALDEKDRFPYLTEMLLKENGLKFNVLNAGVRAHTTMDTINLLFYMHR